MAAKTIQWKRSEDGSIGASLYYGMLNAVVRPIFVVVGEGKNKQTVKRYEIVVGKRQYSREKQKYYPSEEQAQMVAEHLLFKLVQKLLEKFQGYEDPTKKRTEVTSNVGTPEEVPSSIAAVVDRPKVEELVAY